MSPVELLQKEQYEDLTQEIEQYQPDAPELMAALFWAAEHGSKDQLEFLLKQNISLDARQGQHGLNILALAIKSDCYDKIMLILELHPDMEKTVVLGGVNILHLAVIFCQPNTLKKLLDQKVFSEKLHACDYYDINALVMANRSNSDNLQILSTYFTKDEVIDAKNHQMPIEIAQDTYITKNINDHLKKNMDHYNQNLPEDIKYNASQITSAGYCNGLSSIFLRHCISDGNPDRFYDLINQVAQYHETKDDTFDMEQFANDACYLQGTLEVKKLMPDCRDYAQPRLARFLKLVDHQYDIKTQFDFKGELTIDQLAEILSYFKQYSNLAISIGGEDHANGLFINEGQFYYYEPNAYYRTRVFSDPSDLATAIYLYKYQLLEKNVGNLMSIVLNVWSTVKAPDNMSESQLLNSPNQLNKLHCAVFRNDYNAVEKCIKMNPVLVNQEDAHGSNPIKYAINFGYNNLVEQLAIHSDIPAWRLLKDCFVYDNKQALAIIIKAKKIGDLKSLTTMLDTSRSRSTKTVNTALRDFVKTYLDLNPNLTFKSDAVKRHTFLCASPKAKTLLLEKSDDQPNMVQQIKN